MSGFNWHAGGENVVFKTVQAVAVYLNPDGDLVIRQEAGSLDDDDHIVIVPRDRVEALALAMQSEAGIL